MSLTLETAQAHLDAWLAADLAVAQNQSYSVAGRSLSRADSAEIRQNIAHWRGEVQRLSVTSSTASRPDFSMADFSDGHH